MIKTRVIQYDGAAAVVEYEGKRVIIPKDAVDGKTGHVERQVFECGIPFGVDFESLFEGIRATTGADLARAMHELGIWTVEDVLADSRRTRQAIQMAHGTLLTEVLNRARQFPG